MTTPKFAARAIRVFSLRGAVRRGILIEPLAAALIFSAGIYFVLHLHGNGPAPAVPETRPSTSAAQPASSAPTATSPQPSFDVVKVGPDGDAVIAGHAPPNARITVFDGGKPLGTATADPSGAWVLIPAAPLAPGERALTLEATDPATGATVKSAQAVALSVAAPAAGGTVAVALPGDAEKARILQSTEPAARGAQPLSLSVVEYDPQGEMVLTGRAAPGATLDIALGGRRVATVTADAAGNWSARLLQPVAPGRYRLRLAERPTAGRPGRQVTLPFERVAADALLAGEAYVVQRGNTLWRIARRTYGAGIRYLIIYSANSGKIRNPDRIYPGQVFRLPKS
jgi:nucleoid-associated protein YgaU